MMMVELFMKHVTQYFQFFIDLAFMFSVLFYEVE